MNRRNSSFIHILDTFQMQRYWIGWNLLFLFEEINTRANIVLDGPILQKTPSHGWTNEDPYKRLDGSIRMVSLFIFFLCKDVVDFLTLRVW
jgi:hypothetical protein